MYKITYWVLISSMGLLACAGLIIDAYMPSLVAAQIQKIIAILLILCVIGIVTWIVYGLIVCITHRGWKENT